MTGIHFHDLRHSGNTLAGEAGASLRELMDRMGHSTTRAALIYQHRTSLRDTRSAGEPKPSVPNRVRNGHEPTARPRDCSWLHSKNTALAARSAFERVTGIEPALSAWESVPSELFYGLTCGAGCPRVTVRDRSSPGLMALRSSSDLTQKVLRILGERSNPNRISSLGRGHPDRFNPDRCP